jgi:hypothetical protein
MCQKCIDLLWGVKRPHGGAAAQSAACTGEYGLRHYRIGLQHVFEWPRRAEEGEHAAEYTIDDGIWTRRPTGECHIQRALVGQPALSGGHLPPVQQKVTDALHREISSALRMK